MTDANVFVARTRPGHGKEAEGARSDREQARRHLEAKRNLTATAFAFLVVNLFLIFVWAFTGAGYFWPGWVLAACGVVLAFRVWDVYFRRPITEADIEEELRRGR